MKDKSHGVYDKRVASLAKPGTISVGKDDLSHEKHLVVSMRLSAFDWRTPAMLAVNDSFSRENLAVSTEKRRRFTQKILMASMRNESLQTWRFLLGNTTRVW